MKPCCLLSFSKLPWPRVARGVAASAFLLLAACSVSVQSADDTQPADNAHNDAGPTDPSQIGGCAHADAEQAGPYAEHLMEQLTQWEAQGGVIPLTLALITPEPTALLDEDADQAARDARDEQRRRDFAPIQQPLRDAVLCAGGSIFGDGSLANLLHLRLPAERVREVVLHPHVLGWSGHAGSVGSP